MTESLVVRGDTTYDLNDRYRVGSDRMLLTGVQAIARHLVEQRARDTRNGRNTATFVSGYQGSPLGGVDRMLLGMPKILQENSITFVPGMNEELAATSVWGSQADLPAGNATHDGVIGVWYGKGPGVDRATDVIRHANIYGVNPKGGVVLYVGDDPASKSSTVPAVSERSLAALNVPVLFPRNAKEIIRFGLYAVELSRASGCVVAVKIVADVADGAWSVDGSVSDVEIAVPEVQWNGKPFKYTMRPMAVAPDAILTAEADLYGPRWEVVQAYSAANDIDEIEVDPDLATTGIVATGTTFDAVRQTLVDLGVDDETLRCAGVRLLRLGMAFPVNTSILSEFAQGLDRIIVVEDKTAFIETQVREALYGNDAAPEIIGKRDRAGAPLVPTGGELTAGRLASPLRRALKDVLDLTPARPAPLPLTVLSSKRSAYFCSGCPHNRSTGIPEGSIGGGGIGCHILVTMSGRTDSAVTGLTQMGGEGAQWIGQAPFTDVSHIFQNIGDGTFFHSGQLAVQACVAAGVNITYKLLYNDVVAMTGAQDAEGALGVAALTHKLTTEGVSQIIVCADEPHRHDKKALARGTKLWHRDRLDEAQRELREIAGVTVLIYDQHCAADARRQRKRGTLPARNTRVIINESVCEGCGDCGVKSNCLSVQPFETDYGRKTRIDQTSCNTDYSCLDGDCPSFVTVQVPDTKSITRRAHPEPPDLPIPSVERPTRTQNVYLTGIGGTGIVTVNQVLATAALRAGYDVESLDQIGLSQKAGPVVSHLRFSAETLEPSNRITPGSADCILAFDLLTATENKHLVLGDPDKTVAVVSTSRTATGDMVYDKSVTYPADATLLDRIASASASVRKIDALAASHTLFGNTASANFLLVGAAYQSGSLRLPAEAVEEAIEINGVAVTANIAAFRWGRAAIADPDLFSAATATAADVPECSAPTHLFDDSPLTGEVRRLAERRAVDLVDFQNEDVAHQYLNVINSVWTAEREVTEATDLTEAVARGLFKFTAYKDEYEVARMLVDPVFVAKVRAEVPDGTEMTYMLHPPALRALGRKKKIRMTPRTHAVLRLLAKGKGLRGTALDPFGYAKLRRVERALLAQYTDMVDTLARNLDEQNYAKAVTAAGLTDVVRGYEHIKLANIVDYCSDLDSLGIAAPASFRRLVSSC